MWESIVAFCAPFIAWCKGNIAEWHATTVFNIAGWVVDKFEFMAGVVAVVVFVVLAFFIIVGLVDPDKAEDGQRRRPPYN